MRYSREGVINNPPRKYSNLWKAIEMAGLKFDKYWVVPSVRFNCGIQYAARVQVKRDVWGVVIFRDRRAKPYNPMNWQAYNRKLRLAKRKGWPLLEIWPGSVDEMWAAIEKWRMTLGVAIIQLAPTKNPYILNRPKNMRKWQIQIGERSGR
jgi:hypothetical protein